MGGDERAPLPRPQLAARVGSDPTDTDPFAGYLRVGRQLREDTIDLLPADWTFAGKRVLDFGCGAGRVLRHYLGEAEVGEFHGCDVDRDSIDWLERNLSPPLRVFPCGHAPPLPRPDGFFDLVWAFSVFTHITDQWSAWLLELHRVIKDDGLLIATFQGPPFLKTLNLPADDPVPEERLGMNVLLHDYSWDLGGPQVLHSAWWIREHWGRAFEILDLREAGFGDPEGGGGGQGVVLMRKLPHAPSREELERIDPGDQREIAAMRHNIADLGRESVWFRRRLEEQSREHRRELERFQSSASWRVTAPLRRFRELLPGRTARLSAEGSPVHALGRLMRRSPSAQSPGARARAEFERISAIGARSDNPWIRRSARVPGYLFPGEHELILREALAAPEGEFLVIGAWFGKSTSLLAGAVEERGRGEKVITVDPFTGEGEDRDREVHQILHGKPSYLEDFVRLAKELGYFEQVVPVATFSHIALAALRASVGFAFLDGDHRRDAVERNFELVAPLLVPGARVLFHDARSEHHPEVGVAVERILEQHPELEQGRTEGTIAVLARKG